MVTTAWMRRGWLVVAVGAGLAPMALAQHPAPAGGGGGADVVQPAAGPSREEEVARYCEHVITLANPFFEGRGSGTRGNELASQYVEFWFKSIGLKPAFSEDVIAADGTEVIVPGGSYRQPFPVGQDVVVSEATLAYRSAKAKDGEVELREHTDFEILGTSGSGQAVGELVFAGYGMEKGPTPDGEKFSSFKAESGDDDDLLGAVALVFRFEPSDEKGNSQFVIAGSWSDEAAISRKVAALVKRGVSGIIIANPPGVSVPADMMLPTTAKTARGRAQEIPIAVISGEQADRLLRAADEKGRSLAEFKALADAGGGVIPLPKVEVTIEATVDRPPKMSSNIAGILEGKGALADQYIIVGAHYDHVGDGTAGGSRSRNAMGKTHPGADDNASGTAGLLLLADRFTRAYAALPDGASTRSVMFIAFSGEEMGLIGSRFFVHSGRLESSDVFAMVNMDMIGRLRNDKFELHGTGTAEGFEAWLKPTLDEWTAATGVPVKQVKGGRDPSDNASFYAAGIPVLFAFTGYHKEYHTPEDVSRLINCDGGVKVVDLVETLTRRLAERTEPLVFNAAEPERKEIPQTAADHAAAALPGQENLGSVSATKVRFGIMPGDYSGSEAGVQVGDVFDGTCAKEAGIKIGDRLVKWNGETIDSVEQWTEFLRRHKVGDEVEVGLVRDGKEMTVKVKLKGRDEGAK